jgi:glutamate synthase (NADPH/NADH) large chain
MGANRVAFGALLASGVLGCTICRGCQLDTCHVGIATQIETVEQAQEHGLKKFTPPGADAAESCARFFQAMGEEVKAVVGSLGYDRAQDLVGRYDLLEQISHEEKIDLAALITPLEEFLDLEPIDLPVKEEALVEARAEAGLVRAKPLRMEPKQASHEIAAVADRVFDGSCVTVEFPRRTDAHDRVLGTELSGAIARARIYDGAPEGTENDDLAQLVFNGGSVAGQGFGAFNEWGVTCRVEGGAQDGVGKTMLGGTVSILKGKNADGRRVNGSVGKSFAYGAQRGRLFVRARPTPLLHPALRRGRGLAGEPEQPVDDSQAASSIAPTPRASPSST